MTPPPGRSRAALRRLKSRDSARTVFIALAANTVIAIAKLISGIVSGSTALLAEAAHSFADGFNQVLLGISVYRASAPADDLHPLGHGRERFLWAFLAAMATFLVGGCFSIAIGIRELERNEPLKSTMAAWIVLAISFVGDGTSLLQGLRQAKKDASEQDRSIWSHLRLSSDPTVRAVVAEDGAALIGLLIAASGLFISERVGSSYPDSIASLLIGVLMTCTAFAIGRPLADFLVGKSLPPRLLEELRQIIAAEKAVEEIVSLQAVYIGPEEVLVGAKVRPAAGRSADEFSRAMDHLERALRKRFSVRRGCLHRRDAD